MELTHLDMQKHVVGYVFKSFEPWSLINKCWKNLLAVHRLSSFFSQNDKV